jgi:hypothetical protein
VTVRHTIVIGNPAGRYEFLVVPGEIELVIALRGKPLLPPRPVTAATGRIAKEEFYVDEGGKRRELRKF